MPLKKQSECERYRVIKPYCSDKNAITGCINQNVSSKLLFSTMVQVFVVCYDVILKQYEKGD